MQSIETQFEDGTFRYSQVERHGPMAIYEQLHKASEVRRFEVIRIRVQKARVLPSGRLMPEHEAYPSPSAWGDDAWTCLTLADAQALLAEKLHGPD